jgi:hypothetical protein
MAQVTIYLDAESSERLKRAARAEGLSVSRWIAGMVRERTAGRWPPKILQLAGKWDEFPSAEELRTGQRADTKRSRL